VPEIEPVWDAENRTLWWNGRVVIRFERRAAPNPELLLESFQELRWVRRMPNPFHGNHKKAHEKLRNAIKKLNRRQNVLRFHGGGDGESVRWELIAETRPDEETMKDSEPRSNPG